MIVGGVAVAGVLGLYVAYQVYKVATPTGRAMSMLGGGGGVESSGYIVLGRG